MAGSFTPGVRRRAAIKALRVKWQLYLLLLPALAYIIIFSYGPMHGIPVVRSSKPMYNAGIRKSVRSISPIFLILCCFAADS